MPWDLAWPPPVADGGGLLGAAHGDGSVGVYRLPPGLAARLTITAVEEVPWEVWLLEVGGGGVAGVAPQSGRRRRRLAPHVGAPAAPLTATAADGGGGGEM